VLTVFTIPSVNTPDSVTGSDLVAAGVFGVDGFGAHNNPNDNQWFNVRDTAGQILFFTASSSRNSFEFDMGSSVPEAVDLGDDGARFRRPRLRRIPAQRQGARPRGISPPRSKGSA
jgi:hypothetical protein